MLAAYEGIVVLKKGLRLTCRLEQNDDFNVKNDLEMKFSMEKHDKHWDFCHVADMYLFFPVIPKLSQVHTKCIPYF